MLVKTYRLKIIDARNNVVEVKGSNNPWTKSEIEDVLRDFYEYDESGAYECELCESYRLHSETVHEIDERKRERISARK